MCVCVCETESERERYVRELLSRFEKSLKSRQIFVNPIPPSCFNVTERLRKEFWFSPRLIDEEKEEEECFEKTTLFRMNDFQLKIYLCIKGKSPHLTKHHLKSF